MMRKYLFLGTLLLAPYIFTAMATAQQVGRDEGTQVMRVSASTRQQRITLGLNKAEIVELDRDIKDVDVAGPDIVDAVVKSPRRVLLIASKVGQTNVFFSDSEGRRVLSLDIRVERDVTDLGVMMAAAMPKSAIKPSTFNDSVVLTGSVANAMEASRAVALAAAWAGDPKKVVNMLSVAGGEQVMLKVRIAEINRSVAKQFGVDLAGAVSAAGIPIALSTSNPYGLLGHALSDLSGAQIGSVCPQAFFPNRTATTTSTMTTGNSTVSTVTNGTNNLNTGYNTAISSTNPLQQQPGVVTGSQSTNTSSLVGSAVQTVASALAPTVTQTVTDTANCASANNMQGVMKALEAIGLVHMLAEPNATVVSGETTKMQSGGSFPVPQSKDRDGNVQVEFKDFGIGLSFTPVVLSPERISIQLSTEASELSNNGAFTLQGSTQIVNGVTTTVPGLTIPALSVRRAQTTVELPSGGSFAIAGLMQHVTKQQIDGFPAMKDLPVLGALFRSRDFQNSETELVVIVSAYLVQPTSESALAAPTDGFVVPSDPETLLLGRLNAVYKKEDKPVESRAEAPVGFIVQ
jgi:pilus assembly protein CpaC